RKLTPHKIRRCRVLRVHCEPFPASSDQASVDDALLAHVARHTSVVDFSGLFGLYTMEELAKVHERFAVEHCELLRLLTSEKIANEFHK
ncbi:hypothetical protein PFISCL1PPCAC_12053, partial [Pristionchus fissidentatus]